MNNNKKFMVGWAQWFTPVVLATQEMKIWRIAV
jgi:hypothetical protein